MSSVLLKEAVQYFKREKGFSRLLPLFIKRYEGLGRIGGAVTLTNLKAEEKKALGSWFAKEYFRQKSITVSLADFEAELANTKFEGLTLLDILKEYQGTDLLSNKQKEKEYNAKKMEFFSLYKDKYQNDLVHYWIDRIIAKDKGTQRIHQLYDSNKELLADEMVKVSKVLTVIPLKEHERLPVFSQRVTGNPHYFDELSRLTFPLQIIQNMKVESPIKTLDSEESTELLLSFGILRDDLLNFVTCTGLIAYRHETEVKMWRYAFEDATVINVPLREIDWIDKVMPAIGNIVFIVENSGVFSSIMDRLKGLKVPLICTHGQFKLAGLLLIDKLIDCENIIYYSGDIDPEGLQMAQRLSQRHPGKINFWRLRPEDYKKSLSDVRLDDKRLSKLKSVNEDRLNSVKEALIKIRLAGYQENLIEELVKDIIEIGPYMVMTDM